MFVRLYIETAKENILPGDINFEDGFSFENPVLLTYSDGHKEEASLIYKISPQKRMTSAKGIGK